MYIKKYLIVLVCVFSSNIVMATEVASLDNGDFEDFEQLSLSELLNSAVTVTSSGKQEQKLMEVPESMWVLTADDIRRSGATNVAELMRLIPGMEVVQMTSGYHSMNARIHEHSVSNPTLILVNSRQTYIGFFRSNNPVAIPVTLEEIERIEVILGPGSTLYGSNAIKGIINIITKQPDDDHVNVTGNMGAQLGTSKDSYSNGRIGGYAAKKISDTMGASVSAEYQHMTNWEDGAYSGVDGNYQPTDAYKAQLGFQYKPSKNSALMALAGFTGIDTDYIPFARNFNTVRQYYADIDFHTNQLFFDNDYLQVRLSTRFYDIYADVVMSDLLPPFYLDLTESMSTANIMYRFNIGEISTTTVGIDTEFGYCDANQIDGTLYQTFLSGYLNERLQLTDWLILNAGIRGDSQFVNGETINNFVPQASAVIIPKKGHVLRFSYRKAFAYPSVYERFGFIPFANTNIMLYQGYENLQPIKASSIEGGYQLLISQRLSVKIDLFYTKYSGIVYIDLDMGRNPIATFSNSSESLLTYGIETAITYSPTDDYRFKLAYTNTHTDAHYYNGVPYSPVHRAYISANANPIRNFELDAYLYFMSFYYGGNFDGSQMTIVNPNEIVNVRLAYKINHNITIFLLGKNLIAHEWKDSLKQNAVDAETFITDSAVIGRQIMLGLHGQW